MLAIGFSPRVSDAAATIDVEKVKKEISAMIEVEDEKRADGTSIAPTLVRLAWHASGPCSCLY